MSKLTTRLGTAAIVANLVCFGYACNGHENRIQQTKTISPSPQRVLGLPAQASNVAIASSSSTSCAALTSGDVYCWGALDRTMAPRGYSSIAVKVSLTEEVLDISSTNRISVLLKSKRLMTLFMGILSEIKLPPNEAIAHLSEVDDSQECVVFESGLVGCTEGSSIPAPSTDTPKAVVQIAGGDGVESRGVSLLTDGSVVCGGIHLCGFDYPDSHVEWYGLPTSYGTGPTMPSVPKSRYVSLGCLVGDDGKVYCWGPNGYGELGTGARDWFDGVWRPALNISNAVKVMARDNFHRCALTGDGSLWCWGANHVGQVGNGKIVEGECDPDPRDVTEVQYHCPGVYAPEKVMDDVVDFALGNSHTCAVKKNGDVYCWGSQRVGALGNGVNID